MTDDKHRDCWMGEPCEHEDPACPKVIAAARRDSEKREHEWSMLVLGAALSSVSFIFSSCAPASSANCVVAVIRRVF